MDQEEEEMEGEYMNGQPRKMRHEERREIDEENESEEVKSGNNEVPSSSER